MRLRKNARRAAYEARQEKQGKNVVMWIAIALILFAICFVANAAMM